MPEFDYQKAKNDGYGDEEIARFLSEKYKFDIDSAVNDGYGFDSVAQYLSSIDTSPQTSPVQSDVEESSGFFRQALDVPTQFLKGATTGVRFLTDTFGADNPVSQTLSGAEDYFDSLLSAEAKRDQEEVSRILEDAEDKGFGDQVKAGLQALATSPVDLISNAFGTAVPTLAAGLVGRAAGLGVTAARALASGTGGLTGVGITKSAINEAVREELMESGISEEDARQAAQEAQSYAGENIDNILLGGALGVLAGRFGLEDSVLARNIGRRAASKASEEGIQQAVKTGLIRNASRKALEEAIPEALQGGQEQFASNIALQREGFDTPALGGVVSGAVLEGAVGAPVGAIAEVATSVRDTEPDEETKQNMVKRGFEYDETTKSFKKKPEQIIEDVEQSSAVIQDDITGTTENIEDTEVEQEAKPVKDAKEYVVNNDVDDIVESTAVNKIAEKSSQQSAAGVPITNEEGESFTGHSSVKGNEFIFQVQDNLIVQKNLESAIQDFRKRNKGLKPLLETQSPYLGAEALPGVVGTKFNRFEQDVQRPLSEKIAQADTNIPEVEEFMVLRHALERNDYIRKINSESKKPRQDLEDGGAGEWNGQRLTDNYVKSVMKDKYGLDWNDSTKEWTGGNVKGQNLSDIASDFDQITQGTLNELQEGGLLDEESFDKLSNYYKYYVPLRGRPIDEDVEIDERARVQRTTNNLGIKGNETFQAKGRVSQAQGPVGHIISDRQNAIRRAATNRLVGQRMLNLVRENPNEDYFRIIEDPKDSKLKQKELFGVKEDGKQLYVEFADPKLRQGLLSLEPIQLNKVMGMLRGVNRFLSAVNTSFNPEFIVTNFPRDLGTGVSNLIGETTAEDGKAVGVKKSFITKIVKDTPASVTQVYRGLRNKPLEGKVAEDWKDYLESGAKTEFFYARTPEENARTFQGLLDQANGTSNKSVKNKLIDIRDFVDDVNGAVENGVRFATFKQAKEDFLAADPEALGIDTTNLSESQIAEQKRAVALAKAATLAKNLTVNFNRRGNKGELLNGLYLFFNASVQGTANFARGLSSPAKQRLLLAMASFGGLLTVLNELSSEEDDDGRSYYDKISDSDKERNLIFMKTLNPFYEGDPSKAYKIPLPYGYNVLHVFGLNVAEVLLGQKSSMKAATDLSSAALGSFAPVGFGSSDNPVTFAVKGATPQIGKPLAEVLLNENFFGSPVYTENLPFSTQVPLAYLSKSTTPEMFKNISIFLNEMSGGNESEAGKIVNLGWVSPDVLDHLFNTLLGGAGGFAERTAKTISAGADILEGDYREGDLKVNDIPFIRRFLAESSDFEGISEYYDRREDIFAKDRQINILRGDPARRQDYLQENRPVLLMKRYVDSSDKQIRAINKRLSQIRVLMDKAESPNTIKELEEQEKVLRDRKQSVYDRFNKIYNQRVGLDD